MQLLRPAQGRPDGGAKGRPFYTLVTFAQGETEMPKTSFPLNAGDDSNVRKPHGQWKIRDVER
jgi:hypothetical protein